LRAPVGGRVKVLLEREVEGEEARFRETIATRLRQRTGASPSSIRTMMAELLVFAI